MRAGPLAPVTAPATRSFCSRRRTRTTTAMCTHAVAQCDSPIHIQPQFCVDFAPGHAVDVARTRGSPPYRLYDTYQLPMPHALRGPHVHVMCGGGPHFPNIEGHLSPLVECCGDRRLKNVAVHVRATAYRTVPQTINKNLGKKERECSMDAARERNHACAAAGRHASISDRSETTPQSFPPAVIHTWPMLMNENSE